MRHDKKFRDIINRDQYKIDIGQTRTYLIDPFFTRKKYKDYFVCRFTTFFLDKKYSKRNCLFLVCGSSEEDISFIKTRQQKNIINLIKKYLQNDRSKLYRK